MNTEIEILTLKKELLLRDLHIAQLTQELTQWRLQAITSELKAKEETTDATTVSE